MLKPIAGIESMPTRLDRNPWAVLQNLFVTESAAAQPVAFSVEGERT